MNTATTSTIDSAATVPEHRGPWLTTTDHKRIGLLILGTASVIFLAMGLLAMTMRTQLAQPGMKVLTAARYDQFFTIHGSGMIYLAITPFAIGLGVYLVPLQIGAPSISWPRLSLFAYWLYAGGAAVMLSGFLTTQGAASAGWFAYVPLSSSTYTPGLGMDYWIIGAALSAVSMMILASAVLWTAFTMRTPQMTLMRVPVFTWTMIVTCLMAITAFPALLGALGIIAIGRVDPGIFRYNAVNIGYQHLFWFYGHPVVYIMFFPFVGCIAEVIATFSGRRFFGYKGTVIALMLFSAMSMSVWGHHMFATGQVTNDYYSVTSTLLLIPAGMEYFGILGTLIGGNIRFTTPMLFALAFIPQFLIGGITGIMLGSPVLDYHLEDSYFVVAHFHYTLFAGSVFGFMAGFYYWFPKATGYMLGDRLGKLHFVLMVIGTNVTFLPMFVLGYLGMPRRVATYPRHAGFATLNLISTAGSYVIGISMVILLANVLLSLRRKSAAPADPWGGPSLEWATSSPPPALNFSEPLPEIRTFAPLFDAAPAPASPSPPPHEPQAESV